MSNILVTGDRGFIAGYLIEKLLNDNRDVDFSAMVILLLIRPVSWINPVI